MKYLLIFIVATGLLSCDKTPVDLTNSGLEQINSLEKFDNTIKNGVSLAFFHATWCSVCKAQRPEVEALLLEDELKNVHFLQVDTDVNKDITTSYNIVGQPIILIFKDGTQKHRVVGRKSRQELSLMLKALL